MKGSWNLLIGFTTVLLVKTTTVNAESSSNIFLNSHYKNAIDQQSSESLYSSSKNRAENNIFLNHAIISREAQRFVGPQYLPPKEYIKCSSDTVCVRKNVCQGGYITNSYGSPIQNCDPETDICCIYRPPTTTTEKPFERCSSDSDCVSSQLCVNGEISISNYVKNSTIQRCYAPEICCRLPSTVLTEDGYVFNIPEKAFPLPPIPQRTTTTSRPQPIPTKKPVNEYLPPIENEIPRRPEFITYRPQTIAYQPPQTTTQYPKRRQPTKAQTAPYQPQRIPSTSNSYNSQPTSEPPQIAPTIPSRSQGPYLKPATPYRPPISPESSGNNPIPIRGEDQLSPQIFPTPTSRPRVQLAPQARPQTPAVAPIAPAKCAAALVCTDISYCNSIGVISETPVELSESQAAFRVPLTDCLIAESNTLGKCCRDPNYVDPWPVNLNGYCAQRNKNTKPQGIKDLDANFAEIPWQAMILKESTKSLLCGGTIIGSDIVLTSASCVDGELKDDIRVKGGEWELGSDDEPMSFQLLSANEISIHPAYNPSNGENDLAMVKLSRPFQFATHIGPLCISDQDPSPTEQCITSGWGKAALKIHEQGAIMHRTLATAVSRSECNASNNEVCVSTKFDACSFDVGSALACGSGSNVVLKGIYSRESQCGENQVVKFVKPDIKWINTAFTARNRPLLLQQ